MLERLTCFCHRGLLAGSDSNLDVFAKVLLLSFVNKRVVCNQIEVKDGGIAQKILEKIFQPFFTTKPTGQETEFGLYLSYDIGQDTLQ